MASKTKKVELIRARKASPNKANLKAEKARLRRNLEVLERVVQEK
jgi:hypothetical protein